MEIFKQGIKIKELLEVLEKLPNKPVFIASDEEQNTIYKGIVLSEYKDCIMLAGLSGTELED